MKMNLLMVEDAKIYLILFQQYFENDFHVVAATNVDDAKTIIKDKDFQFDVILLDLMTRGAMGLLGKIKKAPLLSHVPVIVITASDDDKDKIQAFDFGAYDYITKPIIESNVLTRVKDAAVYFQRIRELDSQRDLLMNSQNIDKLTQIYNLDTAKWLVNEKISENPSVLKALFLFKIEGLDDVYLEEGNHRGDTLIKEIARFISLHFANIDIIGRISHDMIIVFVLNKKSVEEAVLKKFDLLRLFKQKQMTDIPEDIVLRIGVAASQQSTSYEKLLDEALAYLHVETYDQHILNNEETID